MTAAANIHLRLTLREFGPWLRRLGPKLEKGAIKGLRGAAAALVTNIQEQIDTSEPHAPVATGSYRAGWKAKPVADGAEVRNDNPMLAALVEFGRRPGPVGAKGLEHIRDWVRLKGIYQEELMRLSLARMAGRRGRLSRVERKELTEQAIDNVAWAVAEKIKKQGFAARYPLARGVIAAQADMEREIVEAITSVRP